MRRWPVAFGASSSRSKDFERRSSPAKLGPKCAFQSTAFDCLLIVYRAHLSSYPLLHLLVIYTREYLANELETVSVSLSFSHMESLVHVRGVLYVHLPFWPHLCLDRESRNILSLIVLNSIIRKARFYSCLPY